MRPALHTRTCASRSPPPRSIVICPWTQAKQKATSKPSKGECKQARESKQARQRASKRAKGTLGEPLRGEHESAKGAGGSSYCTLYTATRRKTRQETALDDKSTTTYLPLAEVLVPRSLCLARVDNLKVCVVLVKVGESLAAAKLVAVATLPLFNMLRCEKVGSLGIDGGSMSRLSAGFKLK